MNVVHIIKATGVAGAERHLISLLAGLRARGIDVHLIILHPSKLKLDDFAALLDERGIPQTRIPMAHHLDLRVIGRLRRCLRDLRPDIVHTHLLHADWYGLTAALLAGVKQRVSTRHNDDSFRRRLIFRLIHGFQWRFLFARGIGISDAVTRFVIAYEGAPPAKLTTIPYGLELPVPLIDRKAARAALLGELNLPPETIIIGGVGRLREQKGYTYALQAFAQVERTYPMTHIIIIGDGPLSTPLHAEARRLGLARRVHFMGWRADAAALMAAFDIFIMPSLWEGFGLVLLEAMARALPVVGSDVSAIPEIVLNGETGLLVPPRDPAALAGALRTLLDDPALLRHMGMMGEDRLTEVFSAESMIAATAAVYAQMQR